MSESTGRAGEQPRAWLVVGEARVLVDREVDAVIAGLGADRAGFDVSHHRGNDADLEGAIAAARTPAFLAPLRVVVVKDLQLAPDRFFHQVLDYLQSPSPTTALVLAGTGWPKVVKGGRAWAQVLPKSVAAVGRVVSFDARSLDPEAFVLDVAARSGARLGREAARRLVAVVGKDLGRLALELEKVALFADADAEITPADVDAACSALAEEAAWALSNAVQAGDAERALSTLARALDEGAAPEALFHQVSRPTRVVLRIAEGLRRGVQPERMQRELGLPPFAFRTAMATARAVRADPRDTLERLARGHAAMHGVRAGDERALEALVLDLLAR